jgi:PAS domain S-box-containing protein
VVEDWSLGLLEWTARQPARFGERDVEVVEQVARYVAPALHRAQLMDDTRERLREQMEDQSLTVPPAVDLSATLQPVVREALEFTDARHAFVFLLAEGSRWLRCVVAEGEQREHLKNVTLRGDGTLGGWDVPMTLLPDGSGNRPPDREVMADLGIVRALILPLRVGGEQVGMLGVAEPRRGRSFGQDAIRLMTHLASQAAGIIERSYRQASNTTGQGHDTIFQASPLGVGVLLANGEIRLGNPALAGLLARSDRSLVGRNLLEFLDEGDGQRLARALEEVSITGQRRQVDARVRSTPAEQRHIRATLFPAPVTNDTGGNLVVIMEDVTSVKILERERVEHLRQLREKHAQLEELDQLKSRFVSNVSHELRTPLAVIKLYATLARKGRPEKQGHYLRTIETEIQRLETMVENILDVTRMDRNALRVSPELLAAEEIIDQVLQVYEETAHRRSIDLRNHVHGELPPLWVDKNHLIQMLTNLVDNALKYTQRDGQVWVAAREITSDSQRTLEIAVGDTGVGIPEEEQDKVFERFYRGSNNTFGATGTGLGLAIVQELMLQHGGQVALKSRVGEGSVFTLQFPLYDEGCPPEMLGEEE